MDVACSYLQRWVYRLPPAPNPALSLSYWSLPDVIVHPGGCGSEKRPFYRPMNSGIAAYLEVSCDYRKRRIYLAFHPHPPPLPSEMEMREPVSLRYSCTSHLLIASFLTSYCISFSFGCRDTAVVARDTRDSRERGVVNPRGVGILFFGFLFLQALSSLFLRLSFREVSGSVAIPSFLQHLCTFSPHRA